MTLRRLGVLIRALPPDARVWEVARAAYEKSLKPDADRIRERQAYYSERGN